MPGEEEPRVLGDYRLLRRLGEGKAGVVYLATPTSERPFASPGTPVAVKEYKPGILAEKDQAHRIENEAKLGSQLANPYLVRIFDYHLEPLQGGGVKSAHLVMEYVDGETLSSILDMFYPLSNTFIIRIAQQLTLAVKALHDVGAVHRDVKPANVLVTSDFQAKLGDFGVVKIPSGPEAAKTPEDKFLGTIRNSSPELLRGEKFDHRTDLYSLGTVLYALLHGHEIFHEENQFAKLIELRLHKEITFDKTLFQDPVKNRLIELTRALLAEDKESRPASASEVADALKPIAALVSEPPPTLHGYVATALTGLDRDTREGIDFVSSRIHEVCKAFELYVYQPRKASDPLLHTEISESEVYRLDRSRVVMADVLFVLANRPSLGVGQEFEIAATYCKPTVLIARDDVHLSRMTTGSWANILEVIRYSSPEDLEKRLKRCLETKIDALRRWKLTATPFRLSSLGARLRALRENSGLSMTDVVAQAGISKSLLEAVESGQHDNLGLGLLVRLAALYGVSASELVATETAGPVSSAPRQDGSLKALERAARMLNWSASDLLDQRDDYLSELAASGSQSIISEEEWERRHEASQKRKLKETIGAGKGDQGKLPL